MTTSRELPTAVESAHGRSVRSALGAHWDAGRVTFAVYSKHATRIVLELFERAIGDRCVAAFALTRGEDDVFRVVIDGLEPGALYGYRAWGPNWRFDPDWSPGSIAGFLADVDHHGHRFNPNKLLLDPYARELSHDRENVAIRDAGHHAEMYGSGPRVYTGFGHAPVVRRVFDTGPWAPKSVVVVDATPTGTKPCIAQKDAVIYEAHVRGFSKHPSTSRLTDILRGMPGFEDVRDLPEAYRGTYRGAGLMAPYLRALGVTTIELLPVHETANDLNTEVLDADRTASEPPHGNYWGYMTYGYFAPDRRYAFDRSLGGPTREFKAMVRAFHEAGIEVYLDVVYNHTAEGGLWENDPCSAELLAFRGLDNVSYYALTGPGRREYWDSTGCGNNLDCSSGAVQRLILDSLRYWSREMGIDGFRFDLATVLGRDASAGHAFQTGSVFLREIAELAVVEGLEVIAEAWDTASYAVGSFPHGWAEWNGRYRDTVRHFLRGDRGFARQFTEVVNGDCANYSDQGGPHKSVNFVVAHDGFTLLDLVSYDRKCNLQPWPFGPSDGGTDDDVSWGSGGDHALRRQRLRNFLAVLLFSRGVPMLLGGDEFGRTQNGNNNPYKIDSIGIWTNYAAIATNRPTAIPTEGVGRYHDNFGEHRSLRRHNGWFVFLRELLAIRRRHASLRQSTYGDFVPDAGDDVSMFFFDPCGGGFVPEDATALQWWIDGSAVGDCDFILLVNAGSCMERFQVRDPERGLSWTRIVDTASWAEPFDNVWSIDDPAACVLPRHADYDVHPHSVVIFQQTRQVEGCT